MSALRHLLTHRLRRAWSYALLAMLLLSLCLPTPVARPVQAAPAPSGSEAPPNPASVRVYWVNDPGDAPDATPGDGVCNTAAGAWPIQPGTGRIRCTLRAAITESNLDGIPSVIAFEICPDDTNPVGLGPDGLGAYTIAPASPLPSIVGGLTYINGYTQGMPSPLPRYDDPSVPAGTCNTLGLTFRIAAPNTASFSFAMNTVLAIGIDGAATPCRPPVPIPGSTTTAVPGGGT